MDVHEADVLNVVVPPALHICKADGLQIPGNNYCLLPGDLLKRNVEEVLVIVTSY